MAMTKTSDLVQTVQNTRFTYDEGEILKNVEECVNGSCKIYSNIHTALDVINSTINQSNIQEKIRELQEYETSLTALNSNMGNLKKQITGTNQKILVTIDESKRTIEKYKNEKNELNCKMTTIENTIENSKQNLQQARKSYEAEKNHLDELKEKNKNCNDVQDGAVAGILTGLGGFLLGGAVTFVCPPVGVGMIIGAGVGVAGATGTALVCQAIKESEESLANKRRDMNNASHRVDTKESELRDAQIRHENANKNHDKAISNLKNEEKKPEIFRTILTYMTKLQVETRKWESAIDEILAPYSWRNSQYESIRNQNRLNSDFIGVVEETMKKIDNETLAIPTEIRFSISYQ